MISYIGGKNRISKFLLQYYPNDMETYLEGFGGMAWCYFNMDLTKFKNLKNFIYNDINPLNSNLFKCVKDWDKLYVEMSKYPIQKFGIIEDPKPYIEIFNECQKEVFKPSFILSDEPNYDVACKYLYVLTHIFSGAKPETSSYIYYSGKYMDKFGVFMKKLKNKKYQEHFEKITIVENLDFCDLVKKYDSETTFGYFDPPYKNCESYYSNHNFGSFDHKRMSECLKTSIMKFGISYYDFPELSEWFPKDKYHWESKEFFKSAAASKNKPQTKGTEIFIMNY